MKFNHGLIHGYIPAGVVYRLEAGLKVVEEWPDLSQTIVS